MSLTWKRVQLKEICDLDKTKHDGQPSPYVGLEHIESNTGRFIGDSSPVSVKSSTFKFGTRHILYGRLRPYLNKAMIPHFEGHCSTEIFPIRPRSAVDRRWLFYWLTSKQTVHAVNDTCTGARMPRANMNQVMDFELLLPELAEQERIVAILDEAFAGIETAIGNTEKNLANARELAETSLERIIRRFDTTEKVLADVVAEDCSLSYGIVQPGRECDEGLPVVRPVDLTQPTITSNGLKKIDPEKAASYLRTKLQGGELLLCVRGTTGTVAQASEELAGGNVTRGIVPIRYSSEFVDQAFGYYLLRSAHVQAQIREKTYGAALMQINIRDLRKIKLNVPPVKQQKEMVVTLRRVETDLSSLRTNYQHKLNSLSELKQSLLQKAFAGELTADRAEEELKSATV